MIFLTLGIGALQVFLDKGQQEDWMASSMIRKLAVVTVVGLILLVIRELTTDNPIMDLRAFKYRNFSAGTVQAFVIFMVLYGSIVLLPIFFQNILGYSAVEAGYATVPQGLGTMAGMLVAGLVAEYVDSRWLIAGGLVLATWSYGAINLSIGAHDLWLPQFFQGAGASFVFVPLTTITYDKMPKKDLGNASAIFNLVRNIGASVGISFVTTLIARHAQTNTSVLGAHVTQLDSASQRLMAGTRAMFISRGVDSFSSTKKAGAMIFGMIQQQAWMVSFTSVVHLLGILFLLILPLVLLMRKPSHKGESVPMH